MTNYGAAFVGFWPSLHTDRQEYLDFLRLGRVSVDELVFGCQMGIYPVGLVVEVDRRQYQILNGQKHQILWPLGRRVRDERPD